jgi:hypothetical protein
MLTMGYKVLGFAVWQGGKWYLRRRMQGARLKFAVAGLAALLVGGAVAAQRKSQAH